MQAPAGDRRDCWLARSCAGNLCLICTIKLRSVLKSRVNTFNLPTYTSIDPICTVDLPVRNQAPLEVALLSIRRKVTS